MRAEIVNQKKAPHLMRHSRRILMALLALACLISAPFAPAARAAGTAEVTLTVKQLLVSDDVSTASQELFSYQLLPQVSNAPMPPGGDPESHTFTIAGNREAQIGPISFNEAGIYTYALRCVTNDMPGYTIDRKSYTIDVYVSEDFETTVIFTGEDGKMPELVFTHSYEPLPSDPSVLVDPPVQKIVNGSPATASSFTFRLTAENPANPMPAGSANGRKTMTILGSGEAEFGTWAYTRAGTYRYTISEVNTGLAGYSYDETVYTITDVVEAVDGQLVVNRSVSNNTGARVSQIVFVNTYTASDPDNPGSGGGSSGKPNLPGGGPKTGDSRNPLLWIILLLVSATLLLFILWLWRRFDRRENMQAGRGAK